MPDATRTNRHHHYYDFALSDWQCRECDTSADYCSAEPADNEDADA